MCARQQVKIGPGREVVQTVSVDHAIEIARRSFPGLTPAYIELPTEAYHPIEVAGRSAYPLVFQTAYINPYSGKVIATHGIAHRSTVALVTESMRPLHTGDFAGLWLKFVYFFFGLLLTTISLSGNDGLDETVRSSLGAIFTAAAHRCVAPQRRRPNDGASSTKAALRSLWRRWWFHLGALMVLVPVGIPEQLHRTSGDAASGRRGGSALG